jgi:hypothetical protein
MPDHWEEQFPYKALLTGQKVRFFLLENPPFNPFLVGTIEEKVLKNADPVRLDDGLSGTVQLI